MQDFYSCINFIPSILNPNITLRYLAFRSGFVPRIFGVLLLFAGTCYFIINIFKIYLPECTSQVASAEMILGLPMAIAEIGFALWLNAGGGKIYE